MEALQTVGTCPKLKFVGIYQQALKELWGQPVKCELEVPFEGRDSGCVLPFVLALQPHLK